MVSRKPRPFFDFFFGSQQCWTCYVNIGKGNKASKKFHTCDCSNGWLGWMAQEPFSWKRLYLYRKLMRLWLALTVLLPTATPPTRSAPINWRSWPSTMAWPFTWRPRRPPWTWGPSPATESPSRRGRRRRWHPAVVKSRRGSRQKVIMQKHNVEKYPFSSYTLASFFMVIGKERSFGCFFCKRSNSVRKLHLRW